MLSGEPGTAGRATATGVYVAVAVVALPSLELVEVADHAGRVVFPYAPGLTVPPSSRPAPPYGTPGTW